MVEYKSIKRKEPKASSEQKWTYHKVKFLGTGYFSTKYGGLELSIYRTGKFNDNWRGLIIDIRSNHIQTSHYYDLSADNIDKAKKELMEIANKKFHANSGGSVI